MSRCRCKTLIVSVHSRFSAKASSTEGLDGGGPLDEVVGGEPLPEVSQPRGAWRPAFCLNPISCCYRRDVAFGGLCQLSGGFRRTRRRAGSDFWHG